jgi:hypothetical protein
MGLLTDELRVKALFKQAMIELLEERRELFYELFADVIEDVMLINSIYEGADSDPVNRDEVIQILGSES